MQSSADLVGQAEPEVKYLTAYHKWLSKEEKKRRKVARRWRAVRRTLSAACASYRRPYSRPAIEADQKVVQAAISRRKRGAVSPQASRMDVLRAAASLVARAVGHARTLREEGPVDSQ